MPNKRSRGGKVLKPPVVDEFPDDAEIEDNSDTSEYTEDDEESSGPSEIEGSSDEDEESDETLSRRAAGLPLPIEDLKEKPQNLAELSDSTDDEGMRNRIGNVPLKWYKDQKHIGYDVTGEKLIRKDRGDALDALLARADSEGRFYFIYKYTYIYIFSKDNSSSFISYLPFLSFLFLSSSISLSFTPSSMFLFPLYTYRTTIYDELNDEDYELTKEDLAILRRVRQGKVGSLTYDPYEDIVPYYTSIKRFEAIGNPQEPKRGFIPSKWEEKKVKKLVNSIRNGWIKMPGEEDETEEKDEVITLITLIAPP